MMNLLTPLLIGFFSSIHCITMCGGLCGLFCRSNPSTKTILIINLGRVFTYTILGFIFAGIIQGLALSLPVAQFGFWIRTLLGLVLIILGLKIILNKTNLHSFFSNNLIWSRAKKQLHKITQGNTNLENLLKGMLWGLIPCGLLYGVLIAAATTQNVIQGGLFMFTFGLGTLPAMFVATGMIKLWQQYIQSQYLRYGAGIFIISIGLWSIVSVWFSHELIPNHPVFTSIAAFLDSCIP